MSKELRDLARRLESGGSDTEAEARLNEALDSDAMRRVLDAVRGLPDDEPSLAWRSALNDEIRRRAPKARRSAARPAIGFALAASLAVFAAFLVPREPQPPGASGATSSLEASLLSRHREMVRSADIAGVGVTPHEQAATHRAVPAATPYDWSEVDLETL